MHSFIIESTNNNKIEEHIQKLCEERHIGYYDISTLILDSAKKAPSIGIEAVREIQKTISLAPFQSPQKTVIIPHAELLTIEAQNALLKILEEPPAHTIIILTTENLEILLPTVRSRCTVITLNEAKEGLSVKKTDELFAFLKNILTSTLGERLFIAQEEGKTKEATLLWIKNMVLSLRNELSQDSSQFSKGELLKILKLFQKHYKVLSTTNANPRLTLENLLLSI